MDKQNAARQNTGAQKQNKFAAVIQESIRTLDAHGWWVKIEITMVLACPVWMPAQIMSPPALLRGVLLERDPQTDTGEFSVRDADNQVFRFLFDAKTYVERDQQSIDVSRLRQGERVEVVSDVVAASLLRYAVTIHVLPVPDLPQPVSQGHLSGRRVAAERLVVPDRPIPYGTVGIAGVVLRYSADHMVLHTRESGNQTILLRQDTRYLENGIVVGLDQLKPNLRIFVRAGRSLYNEMEAYQVIWGSILQPR